MEIPQRKPPAEIRGRGDTLGDRQEYLERHPELAREGYRVFMLGNVLLMARELPAKG